jgi:hypothetical protein
MLSGRKKNVRRKLNAMALEFAGKNVLIVDGNPFHAFIKNLFIIYPQIRLFGAQRQKKLFKWQRMWVPRR